MSVSTDLIYDIKRKMLAKYPRFGTEIASANIEYRENLPYRTAATDGKNIYIDPNFFASLSESDKFFIIAHEIMHIKFLHMYRLENSEGKKRDFRLWNIATDAIINANLERDGFKIKEGYINMPEALNYSAEEFYQILLQEEQKKKQEKKAGRNQNGNGEGQENSKPLAEQGEENVSGDDHTLWKEAFEQQQNSSKSEQQAKDKNSDIEGKAQKEDLKNEQVEIAVNEKDEFEDNRKEKRQKFQSRRQETEQNIRGIKDESMNLENIGDSKEEIDWKLLIRKEFDRTETIWSQRRSIAENNYAYRLEEYDIEDEAETEVMIDASGSVDLKLVKGFLRQIKPLLKHSKLRVGCFNEKFWGFKDIKNLKDIEGFRVPRYWRYSGTNLDLPVRSFTKKREINKIIFTDGYASDEYMPKEDLKKENVVWLVYGNKEFKPCCGKVINITEKQLEKLYQNEKNIYVEDRGR